MQKSTQSSIGKLEGELMHEAEEIDHILGDEYEHKPVPNQARRSLFSITMVWIGFPMIITGAMTGSLLVLGMGFQRAIAAMVIGNLLMFAYVGALGVLATKTGLNFALMASSVFGKKGYAIASGLLSTLLLGWYAVQTGITGNLVSSAFSMNYVLMTILAGVIYIGITFVGVRGLHYIGMASVPLFLGLGFWVISESSSSTTWSAIFNYAGNNGVASMSLGAGLTMVIALFADAGTVSGDFSRWARTKNESLMATFSAFPFANLIAMLIGGIFTAALAVPNANPFGMDNMFGYAIAQKIGWLSILAVAFLYINLGSVCSHCLYNSAIGWSRILHSRMRIVALVLGAIGIAVAAGNVWAFFIQWLSLLGILVPPIGAIILIDQYFIKDSKRVEQAWRWKAFAAWVIGSVVAFIIEKYMPQLSTAISSAVVGGASYWAIMAFEGEARLASDNI
ncbi:purine-cytosine permease family protein [Thiomonas sp.]